MDPFNSDSTNVLTQTQTTLSAESHQNSGAKGGKGSIQNLIQAADDKITDAMEKKKALLDKQKKQQDGEESESSSEGEVDTSMMTTEQLEQHVKAQDKKMQA